MDISSISSSISTEDSVSSKSLQSHTLCWRAHLAQAIIKKSIFTATPISEANEAVAKNVGLENESNIVLNSLNLSTQVETLAPIPKKAKAVFSVVLYQDNNDNELSVVHFNTNTTINHDTKTVVDTDNSSQHEFDDDFQLFTLDD